MQTLLVANVPPYANEDKLIKALCKQFGQPVLDSSKVLPDRKCSLYSLSCSLTRTHTGGLAFVDFDKDAVLIDLDFLNFENEELTFFRLIDNCEKEEENNENFTNATRITACPPSPNCDINRVEYPLKQQIAPPSRPYPIFFTKSRDVNRHLFERDIFALLQCNGMKIAAELEWDCTDQAALLFRTAAARDEAALWLRDYSVFPRSLVDFELELVFNLCILRVDRVSGAFSARMMFEAFQYMFNGRVVGVKMRPIQLYAHGVDEYVCFALQLGSYATMERLMHLSGSRELFSIEVEPRLGVNMVTVGPFPASFSERMLQVLQNEFGPILRCEREYPAVYHGLYPSVCHIQFADEETAQLACQTRCVLIGSRLVWMYRD